MRLMTALATMKPMVRLAIRMASLRKAPDLTTEAISAFSRFSMRLDSEKVCSARAPMASFMGRSMPFSWPSTLR
jgi:hypothetical protein